ncbi:hypothetical protein WG66_015730 [Moniliophthora roreri]|uniref:Uncharacterized protein n=1 Tax=Moniliophthora roreri TaxID=221103 RepID=A0A0W0FAY9_MONRR|nr:hypothetical protein WG66_015730 [Moniliophthora roreri]
MSQNNRGNHRGRVIPRGNALAAGRGRGTPLQLPSPSPTTQVISPAPQQGTMPPQAVMQNRANQAKVEEKWMKLIIQRVLGDWQPHPLSANEINNLRRICDTITHELDRLVAFRQHPGVDHVRLEQAIWIKRYEYKTRYFRLFRVNDLPNEIISNILRFVVWSAPNPTLGILWRLHITWVCKHWREAALSDPTIWNAVWFRDPPPFTRSLAWVERAGSSFLDLRINDFEGRRYTPLDIRPLLVKLAPKLSNLRMLILLFENWEPILEILQWLERAGQKGVKLNLERFELHRTGSPYIWPGMDFVPEGYGTGTFSLFGGQAVSTLSYFTMNGVHLNWDRSVLENLSTLDIRRMPVNLCPSLPRFRELLTKSPRLTKLSLDGAGPNSPPDPHHGLPPVELRYLKTLVIANFTVNYIHSIMTHFTAPNLKDLTFMNFFQGDYTPLYEFVTGRFPTVKLLTLYTIEIPRSAIEPVVRWLYSMPLLTYLRAAAIGADVFANFLYEPKHLIRHPKLDDSIQLNIHTNPPDARADAADSDETSEIVCPNLAVIECQRLDEKLLADFGRARKMMGAPVKKIYIAQEMAQNFTKKVYDECMEAFSEMHVIDIGAKTPEEEELLRGD